MTAERKEELQALAADRLNNRDWFDFNNFHDYVSDGTISEEELDWLDANAVVTVTVEIKQ